MLHSTYTFTPRKNPDRHIGGNEVRGEKSAAPLMHLRHPAPNSPPTLGSEVVERQRPAARPVAAVLPTIMAALGQPPLAATVTLRTSPWSFAPPAEQHPHSAAAVTAAASARCRARRRRCRPAAGLLPRPSVAVWLCRRPHPLESPCRRPLVVVAANGGLPVANHP